MASRFITPTVDVGQGIKPASGAKLNFFETGTSTPKDTFTDSGAGTPNANPVIADSNGVFPDIFISGTYKVILTDKNDIQVGFGEKDQVNEVATAAASVASTDAHIDRLNPSTLAIWQNDTSALAGDVVTTKDRTLGSGGGAVGDVITGIGSADGTNVVAHGTLSLSFDLRISNERPDVAEFGGIGDATTENSAVFTKIESLSFSDVYVPDGTYKVTGVTLAKRYRGPGLIIADGKEHANDTDFIYSAPQGPRNSINFETGDSVTVKGKSFPMGGFRMHGQYFKDVAPVFKAPSFLNSVDIPSSLPFGIAAEPGWYAIFANANDGDSSPSFVAMPFLRVGSVLGSVITLNSTQENVTTVVAQDYTWTVNALANVEALIINETISGRINSFSGRETTVTANTAGAITLDTIGSVDFGDWILLAPNDKDHYRYCGSFLYENSGGSTEEVRNIADTGSEVKAKMVNNLSAPVGSQVSSVRIPFGGMISPLASAAIAKETSSFSTATVGAYASRYDTDSSAHTIATTFETKEAAATMTVVADGIVLPFSFSQDTFYLNFGNLAALRSGGTLEVQGWIET